MKDVCVVTGGAGFIGSHLCEKLLRENFKVICVDNLSTGRKQNIIQLSHSPEFKFVNYDLNSPVSDELRLLLEKADFIFHLASPASPNKKSQISYYAKPVETLMVNSYGSYQLLKIISVSKAKYLYASTSEVYGDPLIHPQTETYWGNVNSIGERSCYDEAKRFGEAIAFAFYRKHSIDQRIIRIFNTYGPRMHKDDGRAVVEFINNALTGRDLIVFGKGTQTRSFCYISDMIDGIYRAMFENNTKGEVINLGTTQEITIVEIAKKIIELTKSSSKIIFDELPQDDPKKRQPDINKAKRLLKWQAKVDLTEGLDYTIDFFRNYKT